MPGRGVSRRPSAFVVNEVSLAEYEEGERSLWAEDAFVARILRLARENGWLAHHDRPARRADGSWRTAVQGDIGFPDLVLVGGMVPTVLYVECKSETGTLSPEQKRWRDALQADGALWRCWRPRNWPEIEEALTRG